MDEPVDIMRKRLHMRSIRRGIKEMDLILSAFSQAHLAEMDQDDLALYDQLLSENDQDLYQWISGQSEEPQVYGALMVRIRENAVGLTKP